MYCSNSYPHGGEMTDALANLSAATQALAAASTLEEVKQIHDMAQAAQTYARAAKLGLEAQNHAAEIKLRAERKAGELLAQLERDERAGAGRPPRGAIRRAARGSIGAR